jgi:hypothetical protein
VGPITLTYMVLLCQGLVGGGRSSPCQGVTLSIFSVPLELGEFRVLESMMESTCSMVAFSFPDSMLQSSSSSVLARAKNGFLDCPAS